MTAHPEDAGYSGAAFLGAVILTWLLAPIAVIVAFIALSNETSPRKRSQLKTWAWLAAGWVGVEALVLAFAFAV